LLAAHYDSVPAGPGAADDAAGVAAVLEIAHILSARPTRHPVILLLTDGEEAGLLGALLFVRQHSLAHRVKAAVNLEGRGDSGPSLMFETGAANTWLMQLYQDSVARPITDSLFYTVYRALPNDTDFTAFKAAHFQGYNFAYIGNVGRYHTPLDTVSNLSLRTLQHQGDNALSVVVALANADSLRAPPSDAVFADVLSRRLMVWPASVNLGVAALTLLLLLVEAALFRRRRQLRVREIVLSAFGALASVGVALLASVCATALVWFVGKLPLFAWIAHPQGCSVACAAIVLAAAGLNAAWLATRCGFWGAWFGSALLLASWALGLAFMLPGVSFIALAPAAVAALFAAPCAWPGPRGVAAWSTTLAILAPLFTVMMLLSPIVNLSYPALGILSWPVMAVLLSFAAMLLLPLLMGAPLIRQITIFSGFAAAGGVLITLLLPTYSAQWPLRLNFQYLLDSDAKQAFWIADPASRALPARVAGAAPFSLRARPAYAGSNPQVYFAPAPLASLDPPQLTVALASGESGRTTRYRLHLQSPRGAPHAFVIFPPGAGMRGLRVITPDGELPTPLYEMANGATRVEFVGVPSEGMDFEIDSPARPVIAQVFDASYELPAGEFLQRLRGTDAASAQDGDVTVVQRTVTLSPAAGR
jgi:hypothetical protein